MDFMGFGATELLYIIPTLGSLALAVYLLAHMFMSRILSPLEKVAWTIVIIFIPFFGSLLYIFMQYRRDRASSR